MRLPNVQTVFVLTRWGLAEQANRRHLWWMAGVALALVIGLAILGASGPMPDLTAQDTARLFAQGAAGFYTLVAVVVLGMGIIRPEIDSGVAALILARPVTRGEYVLGRYLANALTLFLTVAIMGFGAFLVVLAGGRADWTLLYSFAVLAFNATVILATMVLLAVLFGTIATAILGFLTYEVVGNTYLLAAIIHAGLVKGITAKLLMAFVYLSPHVLSSPLVAGTETTLGDRSLGIMPGPTPADFLWSLAWMVGPLVLATVIFRRREL